MMRRTEGEMNDAMEMKLENTSQLPLKDQLGELLRHQPPVR